MGTSFSSGLPALTNSALNRCDSVCMHMKHERKGLLHLPLFSLPQHNHLAGTICHIHRPLSWGVGRRGCISSSVSTAVNTAAPALSATFVRSNNQEECEVAVLDDARNNKLTFLFIFLHFFSVVVQIRS